jgi:translation initiation factor 3 subunit A
MYEDELLQQQEEQALANNAAQNEILSKEDEEINRQIEQANKERREFNERLKKEEKKLDHFVRASHENEIPLIKTFAEQDSQFRKKFWEEKELERIENMKKEMQVQAENKERVLRMLGDKEQFESEIHAARKADFDKRVSEFMVELNVAREKKLKERREQRKQERRAAYLKQIEEKKKREEEEKRRKEDEEKRRKQDEVAEKQRKREQEIEQKLLRERQQQVCIFFILIFTRIYKTNI